MTAPTLPFSAALNETNIEDVAELAEIIREALTTDEKEELREMGETMRAALTTAERVSLDSLEEKKV